MWLIHIALLLLIFSWNILKLLVWVVGDQAQVQNTRASDYVSQISKLKLSMECVCLGTSELGMPFDPFTTSSDDFMDPWAAPISGRARSLWSVVDVECRVTIAAAAVEGTTVLNPAEST